jgi:hypothetical protein
MQEARAADMDNGKHGHFQFFENAPCRRQAASRCVVSEHLLFISSVSLSLPHVISLALSLDPHFKKHVPLTRTSICATSLAKLSFVKVQIQTGYCAGQPSSQASQAASRCVGFENLLFISSVSLSLSHVVSLALSLSIHNARSTCH